MPLGLISGYLGGWVDALLSRITDAMLAVPFLILAIALAAFLGPSLGNAMIAIGVTTTPIFIRLTRGQVMAVKVEDYVEAARAIGNPRWRIALFHILPNIMPALLVQGTLSIAAAIIAEAALSFLGLGQQPPAPSWGSMLNSAQRFLTTASWMAIWPGLAIFLTVLSFNLVGDGLRDALDPKEKITMAKNGEGEILEWLGAQQGRDAQAARGDREHRRRLVRQGGRGCGRRARCASSSKQRGSPARRSRTRHSAMRCARPSAGRRTPPSC